MRRRSTINVHQQVGEQKKRSGYHLVCIWAALFMCLAGPLLSTQSAQAQGNISVSINGRNLDFGAVPPQNLNGRVLVPLRGVFEALGATVDYNAASRTVLAARGATSLELVIGSAQAQVNGRTQFLDVPAQAVLGRTLVPLRFVSEALGAGVSWDARTQTVYITDTTGTQNPIPVPTPYIPPVAQPTPTVAPVFAQPTPTKSPYSTPDDTTAITGTVVKVDSNPPPTISIRDEGGQFRTYPVEANAIAYRRLMTSAVGNAPGAETVAAAQLKSLVPGEEVRLLLDNNGQVTQIVSTSNLVPVKVQFVQGNRIILDDNRNTTLTIGPNMRFINAQGKSVTSASLNPGDSVALFITPTSRTIYQVSALRDDVLRAGGQAPTNLPPVVGQPTPLPAVTAPQINLVQHSATRPLKAGETIAVTVRGTAGLAGNFDLSPRLTRLPLRETAGQPGVYTGTYTVRNGDDVLDSRVTARLVGNGQETTQQSQQPVTFDTIAPRITFSQPRDTVVPIEKPNIVVYAGDVNGSGLAGAQMTITNNGATFEVPTTVAPGSVSAVSTRALSGPVTVNVTIADNAGNTVTDRFNFTARPTGAISSVTHSATRPLQAGETITVEMRAEPRGRASFDVLDSANRLIAQAVPMTEIEAGRYQGTYLVQGGRDTGDLKITGRYVAPDGQATTADATTAVQILGAAPTSPTITTPTADQRVTSPLVIRGRAVPNATVEVSVKAEGTQLLIFRYEQELGTVQVKADANGNWATTPIELPQPSGVRNLRYTITAVQTDAADRRSEAATVAVSP